MTPDIDSSERIETTPQAQGRQDPRQSHDDPLLDALMIVCKLHNIATSRNVLTTGLPLEAHTLTIETFPRAAGRAGLKARVVQRPLENITAMSLPAILLLKNNQTAVLIGWDEQQRARLLPSETEGGEIIVSPETLAENYSGRVIFISPEHEFDAQPTATLPRTTAWFQDTLRLSKFLYVDAVVASFLVNLVALAAPLFVMNVYDRVVPNQATATLWVLAIGISIAYVFDFVLKILRGICLDLAGKKTDLVVSSALFERLLGMKMKLRPPRVGSFAQNFQEFQSIRDFLSSLTLTAFIDLPFTLLILLVIGIIGGPLVFIPLLCYPLALLVNWLIQRPLMSRVKKTYQLSNERQAMLVETLTGLDAIKINNAQSERQYQWEHLTGQLSKLELRVKSLSYVAVNFTAWLQQFSGVAIIVAGVYIIIGGNLSMGGLIACYLLHRRAMMPIGQLCSLITRYQRARMTKATIDRMMNLEQEVQDDEVPLKRETLSGAIELRDVTFVYPGNQYASLSNVSLTIQPGEKVGIIGRSGSGKSSLAKLLVGFYQPDSGNVLIDGIDARQIDVHDLRHNIGYAPQDIHLFSGTLRENLVYGASYVDDETMLRVATLTGVHEFARRHPSGYNMQVGERGMSLSGGQRQAVALARALLLDPPVLLMDEPTSSMDNTSEDLIKKALIPVISNKTLLMVTHRASLLTLVDRLIIVDNGKIIADGPKESVMSALKKGQIHANR
ncbi:type I secretion system permease/ATPase [Leclercia adecarboxylata ATCC 23216 = NBRC 102595]|uniref:type I secretion system permease/ATPase n=1 Tax=Leclercia sp. CFBP8987 TaxID=3096525 RepID=UPI0021C072B4|nr:type I secretion system permease/ATPase [Leclercia sp. CFBP8987]MCT9844540.1 type I secretion system permease/ATPase [Leclercia adecarboxylata ATCC 23216 = NBRC 102595]MDY0922429.1 type I secretion system permease/ATPase [Leclercia sp. CFBP8987]